MTNKGHKKFRRPQQPEPLESKTPKSIKKRPHKGCFRDGKWWCNCDPRLVMRPREVTNETPNKGRHFYKCYVCKLFLWVDEVKARETGLVATTPAKDDAKDDETHAAEPQQPKTPSFTQKALEEYGYQLTPGRRRRQSDPETSFTSDSDGASDPGLGSNGAGAGSKAPMSTPPTPTPARTQPAPAPAPAATGLERSSPSSSKRKRDVFEEDEFSDVGSEQEREMIKSVEKAEAQKRYTTPSNIRPADIISGLPTPSVARTLFPPSKRQKHVSFEESSPSSTSAAPPSTPALTFSGPQLSPPSTPEDESYNVTEEVMQLLRSESINPNVLRKVQATLTLAARRTKGFILGRETAKSAIKARNEEIAALKQRIAVHEDREKAHRKQVTNMKAGLMKLYEEN